MEGLGTQLEAGRWVASSGCLVRKTSENPVGAGVQA